MESNTPDPERGIVIVEDLDLIESRREAEQDRFSMKDLLLGSNKGDELLWRRLFRFAKPYIPKIIFCVLLSSVVGAATGGKIVFIKGTLQSILDPQSIAAEEEKKEGLIAKLRKKTFGESGIKDQQQQDPEKDQATGEALPRDRSAAERELAKNQLYILIILLLFLVLFEQTGVYFQSIMIRSVGQRIIMDIRNALFARVMSLSLKFHNKNHSGKLISRLTNDLQVFGNFFTHTAVEFSQDVFTLLGCVIFLIWEGGWTFIFMVALLALVFLPIQAIGRRIRRRDKLTQRSTSALYIALSEALAGQKIIKAFGTEDLEYEKFKKVSAKTYRNIMKVARLRSRTRPVVELMGAMIITVLIYFMGPKVIDREMAFPSVVAIITALTYGIQPLRRLARTNNNIQSCLASADRVATILFSEPEIQDKPGAGELEAFHREIAYEEVTFEHDQGIPVLFDISLKVKKGEVVALVGPSGSGKTTMVDLLPRFYEVRKGRITIDGKDIQDLTIRSLRRYIGIVSQETILFNESVRTNISYGIPDCEMDRIEQAAAAANAHDFIMEMEEGYDTLIGERGVRLSGGQRQRLAIARALLKNPPILILDEATSSLDSESERQVQDALSRLMKGRTTFVIAHRLSTICKADKIIVLKDGRIVEIGRHEELLAKGGTYSKLHELQTQGTNNG